MEFSGEEKIGLWLDSFPLEEEEKSALLAAAKTPNALLKDFSVIFKKTVKKEKSSVYNNMLDSLKTPKEYFSSLLSLFEKEKIIPITRYSKNYPKEFLSLSLPPLVLYAKGNLQLLKTEKLAIVGARATPESAMRLGKQLAHDLSYHFTILSGTAFGGDYAAISGGLCGSKKVISFLAGGFSALPKNNDLLPEVEKNGLLLSAAPYFCEVRNFSYTRRNELLAALSQGVLVLSAGEKSGTLLTVDFAQKQGKPIFAVPYFPTAFAGTGANGLIKKGAYLTENSVDILSHFGIESKREKETLPSLTQEETAIIDFLKGETEISVASLSQKIKLPIYQLAGLLTSLEIKGLILKTGGNKYTLAKKL